MTKREAERREKEQTVAFAQVVVREAAYNVAKLHAIGVFDEAYSRAHSIYSNACALLRKIDGDVNAELFIKATYFADASY